MATNKIIPIERHCGARTGNQVMVPWSGGLDSTYLVYKNLEVGNDVFAPYFKLANNVDKVRNEMKRRIEMIDVINSLKLKGNLTCWHDESISVNVNSDADELSLKQNLIWLMSCLYSSNSNISEIQIAYIMGDCSISYMPEMQKIWKSFQPICQYKLPKLKFPLVKASKDDIAIFLHDGLKSKIWSCEYPVMVNGIDYECLQCEVCKRSPLLKLKPEIPKHVLKKEPEQLNFDFGIDYCELLSLIKNIK